MGLIRPSSGSLRLFDKELGAGYEEALRKTGAIVETPAFYPHMTGRANLEYFQGLSGQRDRGQVERLLRLVALTERAHTKFNTYSLGMKQRLGIAYALLGEPALVLLDEPTNGLDPAGMAEMRGLVRDLAKSGRTVIISSHLLHEVEQICDYVAIMQRGKLVAQSRVADLAGAATRVHVTTNNDRRALEILRASGIAATTEESVLVVQTRPEKAWEITKALAEGQVYVTSMVPQGGSLESFFLEVTGDRPAKPAEKGPTH